MGDCGNIVQQRHEQRLSRLRARGIERVFLVVCHCPQPLCCGVARHMWPIEAAPTLPTTECPLASDPPPDPWPGCEYFPHFGALVLGSPPSR